MKNWSGCCAHRLTVSFLLSALCVFLIAPHAHASSGTEGAAFLDIPVGAGPAALGSAYSAMAADAYAPVWNPAGLGFLTGTQVAAQHLSYLQSIHYEFLSAVHPVGEGRALGVSAQYLGSGDITETDPSAATIGTYSSHYGAYSMAYGQKITSNLSLGFTGKWINAQLADVSANAYVADAGALYEATDNVRIAATVNNIGTKLKFSSQGDTLPRAAHLAIVMRPQKYWLATVEGVYSGTGLVSGRAGVEWKPLEMIALRAGYKTDTVKGLNALAGMTAGIGVKAWGQELSYAWLPYGDLGDTQYFSLLVRFGQNEEERKNLIEYKTIRQHRTVLREKRDGNSDEKPTSDEPDYQQLMQLLSSDENVRTAEAPSKDKP